MSFERLRALLDRFPEVGVPGCACVVRHHGETVFLHRAGVRDLDTQEPVRPHDHVFLYSASKLATCTAVLQRLEAGDFLLTDPVGEYLPAFKEMTVRHTDEKGEVHLEEAENPVTIRHLMTMTAGLDYNFQMPAIQEAIRKSEGRAPTQAIAAAIAKTPLSFEPGTHWQYSLCHDVLAALVEAVSGEHFSEYVRRHIFEPCGMTESVYHLTPELETSLTTQYRYDETLKKAVPAGQTNTHILGPDYDSGGAGIISTLEDYSLFVDALCHWGRAATGEQILSPRTIELMRTNQLDETCLRDKSWPQLAGYGYGLGVRTMIDPALGGSLSPVGEFGWDGAAGSYALIDPEHELSVFYMQHMLNSAHAYIHPRIRNTVYADLNER